MSYRIRFANAPHRDAAGFADIKQAMTAAEDGNEAFVIDRMTTIGAISVAVGGPGVPTLWNDEDAYRDFTDGKGEVAPPKTIVLPLAQDEKYPNEVHDAAGRVVADCFELPEGGEATTPQADADALALVRLANVAQRMNAFLRVLPCACALKGKRVTLRCDRCLLTQAFDQAVNP